MSRENCVAEEFTAWFGDQAQRDADTLARASGTPDEEVAFVRATRLLGSSDRATAGLLAATLRNRLRNGVSLDREEARRLVAAETVAGHRTEVGLYVEEELAGLGLHP